MMNPGDKLSGFVGQSIGGPKQYAIDTPAYATPGTYGFTAPTPGYYKFVAWGPGGNGCTYGSTSVGGGAGGSGGYVEYTRVMAAGEIATIVVGLGSNSTNGSTQGANTTISFADGKILIAGAGQSAVSATSQTGGAGGVAFGGDVNIAGSQGGSCPNGVGTTGQPGGGTAGGAGGVGGAGGAGGAGAPANAPFVGAAGLPVSLTGTAAQVAVGVGVGGNGSSSIFSNYGGKGMVVIQFWRPSC